MTAVLRKTGLSLMGDIPWGTHFCCFYDTSEDLLDVLVPYFKTGLENGEFCLWGISNSSCSRWKKPWMRCAVQFPDLDRYLANGSLEIVGHDEVVSSWWLSRPSSGDRFTNLDALDAVTARPWFNSYRGCVSVRHYLQRLVFRLEAGPLSGAVNGDFPHLSGVTNVLRHAKATAVDVVMREEGGEFLLTISDKFEISGVEGEETLLI